MLFAHVARMNGAGRTYEWTMSHVWTTHVTHMNKCHSHECVMSHVDESCVTYRLVEGCVAVSQFPLKILHSQNPLNQNSNSSVQIQIEPKFQFEFVLRDAETTEFLDLVDFGDIAFSRETVIAIHATALRKYINHVTPMNASCHVHV